MLIVSNWKAYVETRVRASALHKLAVQLAKKTSHKLVLLVPAPYIGLFAGSQSQVLLGAQDISATVGGATTGEVTAGLVSELGSTYVLVGHSERRAVGETDEIILEKVKHALAHGLTPILCVGERERDQDARYLKEVRSQITAVFSALSQKECMRMVVAYEPIWAIGKKANEATTPEDLREMVLYIRKVLGDFVPGKASRNISVLYGGSTDATNAASLAHGTEIDGFLVGRASTDEVSYRALVQSLAR